MAHPDDYSNLEVGKPQVPSNLEVRKPQPPSDLEVGTKPYYEKEDYSTLQTNQPELSLYDTYKEPTPWQPDPHSYTSSPAKVESTPAGAKQAHPTICGVRQKIFWIILILSIVIVAVVIGGAVGGTVARTHKDKSPAESSGASQANAPATPPASKILNSTRLAGAGWNDTEQVVQQRIYLQGTNNNIWELAWNSSTNVWFTSNEALARAKAGSPLAAAVSYQSLRTVSWLISWFVGQAKRELQLTREFSAIAIELVLRERRGRAPADEHDRLQDLGHQPRQNIQRIDSEAGIRHQPRRDVVQIHHLRRLHRERLPRLPERRQRQLPIGQRVHHERRGALHDYPRQPGFGLGIDLLPVMEKHHHGELTDRIPAAKRTDRFCLLER